MEAQGSKPSENLPEPPLKVGYVRIATGSLVRALPLFFSLLLSIAIAWLRISLDGIVLASAALLITCGLMFSVRKGSLLLESVLVWCLVAIWCVAWGKVLFEQDVTRLLLVSCSGLGSALALSWLRRPWRLPFARPYRQWFEGTWSSTRRLELFLPSGTPVRVHRMNQAGAWIVLPLGSDRPKIQDPIEVRGGGLHLRGHVRSLWMLESSIGVGIEFVWSDQNHQRQMTKIIERFRGASFFLFILLLFACAPGSDVDSPKFYLEDYVQQSFSVKGIEDREKLLSKMTGDSKTRLAAWSGEQFLRAFVDGSRKFKRLRLLETKQLAEREVLITFELSFEELRSGAPTRVTQKTLGTMVLEGTQWKVRELKSIRESIEYLKGLSFP